MSILSFLCAGALALGGDAAVDEDWLAERPDPGAPAEFDPPSISRLELDNGFMASFIPYGAAPKATIRVVVRAGNLNEGEYGWLAEITAELLKEGAGGLTATEIARAAANMGGGLTVNVDEHTTSLELSVLSEHIADAVRLVGVVTTSPRLPEGPMERLKVNALRDLSIARSRPGPLAMSALGRAIYGASHPYGRFFPDESQVAGYQVDDARAFYEQNYGAQRGHIYIAGRFDQDAAENAVRDAFGDWRPGPRPLVAPPDPRKGPRILFVERPNAPQSTLVLATPTFGPENEDLWALLTANTVLGGYFDSRITQNIRSDKGYAYFLGSSLRFNYQDGYWRFRADVDTPSTGAALSEVFAEIDQLREIEPGDDETERARNYMSGVFILRNASTRGLINELDFADFHDLGVGFLNSFIPEIQSIGPDDIRDVMERRLDPQSMFLIVVGDPEIAPDQLRRLPRLEDMEIEFFQPEDF